jgi:hypothetical protein
MNWATSISMMTRRPITQLELDALQAMRDATLAHAKKFDAEAIAEQAWAELSDDEQEEVDAMHGAAAPVLGRGNCPTHHADVGHRGSRWSGSGPLR